MSAATQLFLINGGGGQTPPRPLDGYSHRGGVYHADCLPDNVSPTGRTAARAEDGPHFCESCGELVRYETDYLQVRRSLDGTIYTVLDNTTDRAWTEGAGGWEAKAAEVSIDASETGQVSDVPDALRREIAALYAGLHEYLPEQLLHFSPIFSHQRVMLTCPACGGNGRHDQGNPQLGDNHCRTCEGGSGKVPCPCEECDERAAGRR